jgi:predicted amidohydrolase
VLPETATSGYIYKDRRQFDPLLDTVPGKTTDAIAKVTAQYDCCVTIGIAEIDLSTGLAYNTGALIGPGGTINCANTRFPDCRAAPPGKSRKLRASCNRRHLCDSNFYYGLIT